MGIRHKTPRGAAALERLTVFEGIPHPFDKMQRQVMPSALANLRVRPGRKTCKLGDLASSIGWKHQELLGRLEDKRKTKSAAYYQTKKELTKLRAKAVENAAAKLGPINTQLAEYG